MSAFINDNFWNPWLSKTVLLAALLLPPLTGWASNRAIESASIPTQITLENNGSQLTLSTSSDQWQVTIERASILDQSASTQRVLHDIPYFYRGKILGKANSWVRLSSDSEITASRKTSAATLNLTGHIFVDGNLLSLRHDENKANTLVPIENSQASTKTLRARLQPYAKNSPKLLQNKEDTAPLKAIKIGIMVDSRYNDFYKGRGLAEALSIINGVDGLFQDQLGLAIIVERIKYQEDPLTDPLRNYAGSMVQMLNEFRQVRLAEPEFPAELALVHLFTGNSDPEKLIGVSWIDTLCQLDGYDISISTPYPFNILLSAHEIAHNLGALHDDDLQCQVDTSITGREVMWSELSNTTASNFSSCSLNAMQQSLAASCVLNNIDMALTVKTTPTSFLFEQRVEISAINWDETRTSGLVSSITHFPDSTQLSNLGAGCVLTNTTLTCQHGNINAYSQSSYSVTALLANSDNTLIQSELYFSDFTDSNDLDNKANVQASFTESAMSQTPQLINLALSNDGDNRAIATGGSSGIGSFGLLELLWLSLAYSCISITHRRKSHPA